MKHQKTSAQLNIVARAPFHTYYEGIAKGITAANKVGAFDVLPGHANFFSVLTPGEVVIETDKDPIVFNISNGIISVRGEEVMLFVNM
jgi:F0F1-type ATP synthase epsilon subunit